jgi:hypothetical protein
VTDLRHPPLERCMSQPRGWSPSGVRTSLLRRTISWGTQWGQLDGRSWRPPLYGGGVGHRSGVCETSVEPRPCLDITKISALSRRGRVAVAVAEYPWVPPSGPASKIVTWLILPVVICLSQRLSHACLSISNHTVKLRMAH